MQPIKFPENIYMSNLESISQAQNQKPIIFINSNFPDIYFLIIEFESIRKILFIVKI